MNFLNYICNSLKHDISSFKPQENDKKMNLIFTEIFPKGSYGIFTVFYKIK